MRLALYAASATMAFGVASAGAAATKDLGEQRVREITSRYAACVIKHSLKQARQFVLEGTIPPIDGECLNDASDSWGGQLHFPGENYRYALAGALLMRDFPVKVPTDLRNAGQLRHNAPEKLDESKLPADLKQAGVLRQRFSQRESVWVLDLIGDCTARFNPSGADALARSPIGAAEVAAFEALKPAISGCLPDKVTLRLKPNLLRGAIVLNLYRLAYSVRLDHA